MGSLVKLFDGQTKVWTLGRSLAGFLSHNQSSAVAKAEVKSDEAKRPASAFALFLKEKNPILRQRYPNLKQPQIMKLASSMWKTESVVTKQRHQREYNRLLTEYKQNQSTKELPLRPSPPFVQFFSDQNQKLQNQFPDVKDRVRHASQLWKNLAPVEKQRYQTLYRNKMDEYSNNLSQEDLDLIQERRDAKTLKQQKSDVRRYGKAALKERPVAPSKSAYNVFLKERAGSITDTKNFMKIAGQQWRELPIHEKEVYQNKVSESLKVYEEKMADWREKYDKQA